MTLYGILILPLYSMFLIMLTLFKLLTFKNFKFIKFSKINYNFIILSGLLMSVLFFILNNIIKFTFNPSYFGVVLILPIHNISIVFGILLLINYFIFFNLTKMKSHYLEWTIGIFFLILGSIWSVLSTTITALILALEFNLLGLIVCLTTQMNNNNIFFKVILNLIWISAFSGILIILGVEQRMSINFKTTNTVGDIFVFIGFLLKISLIPSHLLLIKLYENFTLIQLQIYLTCYYLPILMIVLFFLIQIKVSNFIFLLSIIIFLFPMIFLQSKSFVKLNTILVFSSIINLTFVILFILIKLYVTIYYIIYILYLLLISFNFFFFNYHFNRKNWYVSILEWIRLQ